MGFRDDLDLSGIVDRFEVFGEHPAKGLPTYIKEREAEALRSFEPAPLPGEGDDPAPTGSGPLECSTSRQIAQDRLWWAWDPNCLYRALGMSWPYVGASRRDLMRAYQEVDGQSSVRATFAFKMLLNPEFRAMYDWLPLGELWMDDPLVQETLRKRAQEEASRRSEMGLFTTLDDVLADWGYKVVADASVAEAPEDSPVEEVDTDQLNRFDEEQHDSVGPPWEYSYYLWRTTHRDLSRLAAWQEALVREVDQKVVRRLTVGLMGRQPQEFCIAQVQGGWVAFLNAETEVTRKLAAKAADQLRDQAQTSISRASGTPT